MRTPRIESYLRAGRRMLILPLVGLIVGLGAAVFTTAQLTPTYQASASIIVLPSPSGTTDEDRLANLTLVQNLVASVAGLATTSQVRGSVATALHIPQSDVAGAITGLSQPGTQIVTVQATSASAAGATSIADAAAAAIIALADRLRLGGSGVTIQALDPADPPGAPISPRPLLDAALGGLVGLLVGVGFVSLRGRVGSRFRQAVDVEEALGLPTLAIIGHRTPLRRSRSAAQLYGDREIGSAVDGLVSTLRVFASAQHGRKILVTTVDDHAGAPFIGALLAVGLQVHRRRTILVELTATETPLSRFFVGTKADDVAAVLSRDAAAGQPAYSAVAKAPSVLTYQSISAYFDGRPRIEQILALIDTIADNGDDVVVIAPPVLAGGALVELAPRADVLLLTVDIDRVPRGDAARAGMLTRQLGIGLAGLVITGSVAEQGGWQVPESVPPQQLPRPGVEPLEATDDDDRPPTGRSPRSRPPR